MELLKLCDLRLFKIAWDKIIRNKVKFSFKKEKLVLSNFSKNRKLKLFSIFLIFNHLLLIMCLLLTSEIMWFKVRLFKIAI